MSPLTLRFLEHTIDPASFGHEEHLRVAFELLGANDFLEAAVTYVAGVRAIAQGVNLPEKVNVTVTLAYLSIIAERMAATPYLNTDGFIESNKDLQAKNVLQAWYTSERLNTALAREQFVLPDSLAMSNRTR